MHTCTGRVCIVTLYMCEHTCQRYQFTSCIKNHSDYYSRCNRRTLSRSVKVRVHFNACRSPALDRVGNPKKDCTCAICLTCTVYSYIETILLLLRAIYTVFEQCTYVFKQCTYVFQACNFTFKYTVRIYAHSAEWVRIHCLNGTLPQ